MLHPSYSDLMSVVNSDIEEGEQPVVQSRYSIVIATAKRARQIIAGDEPMVDVPSHKPLSIAVEELYEGKVKITGTGSEEDDEVVLDYDHDVLEINLDVDPAFEEGEPARDRVFDDEFDDEVTEDEVTEDEVTEDEASDGDEDETDDEEE